MKPAARLLLLFQWAGLFLYMYNSAPAQDFPGKGILSVPDNVSIRDIARADWNGDGRDDLVLAAGSPGFDGIYVYLRNGASFAPPVLYPSGGAAARVRAADVNLDGLPDVITIQGGSASVFTNSGGGVFLGAASFAHHGFNITNSALADLNADGRVDLLITFAGQIPNPPGVDLLFNSPAGGFGPASTIYNNNIPRAVAAGDLNGDGKDDLCITIESGAVSVLLNNGSGAFGPAADFPTGIYGRDITIPDLNHDGNLDFVTANFSNDRLAMLSGDGTGALGGIQFKIIGFGANQMISQDINNDGSADFCVSGFFGSRCALFYGNGAGGVGTPVTFPVSAASRMAAGDFNEDGAPDLFVENEFLHSVFLFTNEGGALSAPILQFTAAAEANKSAVADFNEDGLPDLAVADASSKNIYIYKNNGAAVASIGDISTAPNMVFAMAAADVNHDHHLDLIVIAGPPSGATILTIYAGGGGGNFSLLGNVTLNDPANGLAVGDYNSDGNLDVAIDDAPGRAVRVRFGDGSGGFVNFTDVEMFDSLGPPASTPNPDYLQIADADWNGALDLYASGGAPSSGGISLARGDGLGNFSSYQIGAVDSHICNFVPAEIDGDGLLDVAFVVNTAAIPSFGWVLAISNIQFAGGGSLATSGASRAVASCDYNFDGIADFVTTDDGGCSLFIQNGAGGFFPRIAFPAMESPSLLHALDYNCDGRNDFCTLSGAAFVVTENVTDLPDGILAFGSGTAGCGGSLGMFTNGSPFLGNAQFGFLATNAPRQALGLGLATDAANLTGFDFFSLGFLLHVDLLNSSQIITFDIVSDPSGSAGAAAAVPNDPNLANQTFFVQSLWLEPPSNVCSAAVYGMVTSKALAVTIY